MGYALIAVPVLLAILLVMSFRIVAQKQVLIIERLGRYHSQANAGVNVIVPFFDSVRARHDLREQITNIEPQQVITKDNVTMEVDAVIYYFIATPCAPPTRSRSSAGAWSSSPSRRSGT